MGTESDARRVLSTIASREAELLGQMGANDVAVEELDLLAMRAELWCHGIRQR
jgi:hypothetical protein